MTKIYLLRCVSLLLMAQSRREPCPIRSDVGFRRIVLQKSKVASVRIFGETLKREAIDNSDNLGCVTEVAYEFSVRR
jgi:hypothetical protein